MCCRSQALPSPPLETVAVANPQHAETPKKQIRRPRVRIRPDPGRIRTLTAGGNRRSLGWCRHGRHQREREGEERRVGGWWSLAAAFLAAARASCGHSGDDKEGRWCRKGRRRRALVPREPPLRRGDAGASFSCLLYFTD
jgi:hypothetical protein